MTLSHLMNKSGLITLIVILFFLLVITLFAGKIPFFWNMVRYSEIAHFYLDNNFSSLSLPIEYDNGNPPFYGLYFAIIWKIFGKSLFISHLAFYPFIFGMIWQVYRLSKKIIPAQLIPLVLIVLTVEPTIFTQSLLMGYDIILLFLFLLAINQLMENKRNFILSLTLLLMTMISIRAVFMLAAIFTIEIYLWKRTKDYVIKSVKLLIYFPAIIFLLVWYTIRYQETGFLFSSFNNPGHRQWIDLSMMIRNIIFTAWKIMDFGRIGLILFIVFGLLWMKSKKVPFDPKLKILLSYLFIIIFFITGMNIPISNPVSHPYFVIIYIFLILISIYLLQYFRWRKIIYTVFVLTLLAGNFWIYPQRFGNGWDASLKIKPYFSLFEETKSYIREEQINTMHIGTKFPLYSDTKYTHLTKEHFSFQDLDKIPFEKCNYILYSNVINTFTPVELKRLSEKWQLIHTWQMGQINIKLYENPDL